MFPKGALALMIINWFTTSPPPPPSEYVIKSLPIPFQTQFASISEHVLESLKDKNPAVRQETINFTVRLLQRSKANSLPKTVMKELCPVLKNVRHLVPL